jgi:heavy metal translocating P-type ATPase
MSLVAPERSPEPPRERRPEQGPAARPDRRHEGGARTNEPDAFARTPAPSVDGTEKLHLKIGGMACSFCVASITRALGRMEGVRGVGVSLAHEEALIEYDPAQVTSTELKQTLLDLGYTVRDATRARTVEEEEADLRRERNNLLVAAGFTLVALFVVMSSWMTGPMPAGGVFPALALWLMPTLALSTVFGPGWHILTMAWASLRRGILNQHVLLEFGAFAGLAGGFLGYIFPVFPRADFFGVAVFITTYHLLSGYVSLLVRTRASQAVRKLLALAPPMARVVRDGREQEVPMEEVFPRDLVRVRPGESIPVDGQVVEGASSVNESLVTGEWMPQEKGPGDQVIGGSMNLTGTLLVRVTRIGAESFLQQVARQVEEARALKPGILALVDRVLVVFVPAVLAVAGAALLIWTLGAWLVTGQTDWTRAVFAALAVLVMGYPCALGMATPLAMIRGGGMAAQKGILMRSAEAFQVLKDVKKVVLDKTGTITRGKPAVVDVVLLAAQALSADAGQASAAIPGEASPGSGPGRREALRLAAAAESYSEHPLARAVVEAAEAEAVPIPKVDDFRAVAGQGVTAVVEGRRVVVGSPRFVEAEAAPLGPAREQVEALQGAGHTVIALAVDGQPAALFALADRLKDDAKEAISRLKALGLEPVMLTGDNKRTARAVAAQAGIAECRAEVLPKDKAAAVRALQRQGVRVAMVGDGINDAPALMQADVGIAIGAGTDIAIEAADVVLIGDRLTAVADAYEIGRASYRKTVQNVSLAFAFNGVGVPLAATGLVHPVWAMVAMVASVSTVLGNSFGVRLLRRPPRAVIVMGIVAALMAPFVFAYIRLAPAGAPGGMAAAGPIVPPVKGYLDGQEIRFIHTEASDPQVAEMLTRMMGSPVAVAPALAQAPDAALAPVYVFRNGVRGEGPFGYQADVFTDPPGSLRYSPLRAVHVVAWKDERAARVLKSEAEIRAAHARGEITIERPGVVVNMPLLTWPGGQR